MKHVTKALFLFLMNFKASLIASPEVAVIAHRGHSGAAPENTLSAFRHAIHIGADYIELDVHLSKDGIPVVIHDLSILRTAHGGKDVHIHDLTLAEIKELDVGCWFGPAHEGERIPTLEDVLSLPLGRTGVMIEVKEGSADPAAVAEAVLEVIRRLGKGKNLYFASFCDQMLRHARMHHPELPLIACIGEEKDMEKMHQLEADVLAISPNLVLHELVLTHRKGGKEVWAWVIDDLEEFPYVHNGHVSGVISNWPDRIRAQIKASKEKPKLTSASE